MSGREFNLSFINKLLLKLAKDQPNNQFSSKKRLLNYMAKALSYEMRNPNMVNNENFHFQSNDFTSKKEEFNTSLRTTAYKDASESSFFSALNRANLSDTQIISVNNSDNEISKVDSNSGYVTTQEHNRVLNIVLTKLESFEQGVENTENRLEIVEDKVETIENILQAADIYTEAAVNIKIQELYKNSPKLHTYYNYFNLGLRDIYIASCSVNSGLVVGNAGHLERLDPND
ncbi:MAG: hypothetical protein ACRCRR_02900, partial [Rickettsia sp.]